MPNWKKLIVSGSSAELTTLKITGTSGQSSEGTSLMINSSGVVGTRELGSNAFNSNTYNNYSLPLGSSSTRGGFKIGYTESGKNYPVEISSEKMYVNVPWTDNNTTYSVGDGGLSQKNFTTTLKNKLDGIAASATNVTNTNQLTNGAGFITSFTNTVDMGDGFKIANEDGDDQFTVTENEEIRFAGGGATGVSFDSSTQKITITSTDNNTTYSVGDGGLSQKNFTTTLKSKLDGIAASANNYVLPTNLAGDDISVDTGALTGATVISDLDFNITTNTSGLVTDANGTVSTRNLTLGDLGYTGVTNANRITNNNQITNGAGYITSFTNTVDMGSGFIVANTGGTSQFTIVEDNALRFAGSGATSVAFNSTTKKVTISSTDTNTTYSVGDGGLSQKNFTTTLKNKLDGIASSATNVTNNNQLSNGAGYITSFTNTVDMGDGFKIANEDGDDQFTVTENEEIRFAGSGATSVAFDTETQKITISSTDTNTDTNTQRAAGGGLTLSGNTLSHTDTSSQSSVNGSGRTYIQDITLDTYGHVTGLSTATETVTNTDTNTVDMGDGFKIANSGGTDQFTVTENEEIRFAGSGATSVSFDSSTQKVTISSTDNNTTYSVGDGGLTQNNFTDADHSKLNGIAASATNVTNNNQISNGAGYRTSAQVDAAIATVVDSAPSALNTLNELAAALGDDADFAGSVTTSLSGKLSTSGKAADSNLLDGLDLHTGRNNEANKVVRTDANGYIQAGWINTTSGATSGTINRIYCSADGYIRYMTPANFRTSMGIAENANNYSHPTFNGDDFSVDTGALTGATVVSDIDINVTTNSEGHVTDANGSVATRTLTLANLGFSGAANANYITNNNQLSNGAGYITSFTNTVDMGSGFKIANSGGTDQFTVTENEEIRFAGSGATSVSFDSSTQKVTISSTDNNTTYSVGDNGLTQKNFTTTLKNKLDGIAASATNVTNNNQLTNGAGYITSYTDTNTTYSPGSLLDLSGTTFNVDLSELTDMTAGVSTSVDEIVLLDNGAQRRKRFSEIFGSNAYNSTTIPTNNNQLSNGAGYITSFTNTVDMGSGFKIANEDGDDQFTVTENEEIKFAGSGATSVTFDTETQKVTISSTDNNTTYSVGDNGLTQKNFTTTLKNKLDGIAASATNVTNNNQLTNGAGYITSYTDTNTVDMGDGFKIANSGGTDQFTVTENEEIRFAGSGATSVSFDSSTQKVTISSTNTTYSVGDNGLTQKNFTSTLKTKLDGIATGATNTSAPYYTSAISVGDGGLTQKNFTTTLKSKLDGIAASATNVTNTNQLTNGAGFTTNTGTLTGNGTSGRVPIYNGSTSFTTDSGFKYTSNTLFIEGNLKMDNETVLAYGGSSVILGDNDGNDGVEQIQFKVMGSTPLKVEDGGIIMSIGAANSEATSLMITSNGSLGTRELGSNAFNSTTIPSAANNATITLNGGTGIDSIGAFTVNTAMSNTYTINLSNDRRKSSSSTDIYTGNTHDYIFFDASHGQRFYTSGAEEMRLENDGDLHVDGDVIAFSTTVSDERLKDNVTTIENPLDKIKALRGVEYDWNSGSRKGKHDLGLIAQEVETVLPNIVHEHQMPLLNDDDEDETVYKTVDYEKMVAVLIEGMKEQQNQIDSLKSELTEIKGRL